MHNAKATIHTILATTRTELDTLRSEHASLIQSLQATAARLSPATPAHAQQERPASGTAIAALVFACFALPIAILAIIPAYRRRPTEKICRRMEFPRKTSVLLSPGASRDPFTGGVNLRQPR